jgi:hypothetical protein
MASNARRILLVVSLLALLAPLGCGAHVPLERLSAEPARYNETRVAVKGRVTQTFGMPMFGQSLVKIEDGTGSVWVKPDGWVPFEGQEIEIEGTLKIGMTLANKNFAVVVIEDRSKN